VSEVTDFLKEAMLESGFDPSKVKNPLLKTLAGQLKTLATLIDNSPKAQAGVRRFLNYVKKNWVNNEMENQDGN
jgi:hypothetical protein